jgi:hypothetical protein
MKTYIETIFVTVKQWHIYPPWILQLLKNFFICFHVTFEVILSKFFHTLAWTCQMVFVTPLPISLATLQKMFKLFFFLPLSNVTINNEIILVAVKQYDSSYYLKDQKNFFFV